VRSRDAKFPDTTTAHVKKRAPKPRCAAEKHASMAAAAAAALVSMLGATRTASAQELLDAVGGREHDYHSPQNFAFELRGSPYKPDIDSDPALNGATPYKNVFGNAPRLFVGAEFDWQALRVPHFGSLGPGFMVGYTTMTDPASFVTPQANGSTVSGETTTLQIIPMDLLAVLRIDVLNHDVGIPLVPYVKVGLGYALWRASNTLGTSHADGITGEGHSIGWLVAGGLAFDLTPFDAYSAQNLDDSLGINHTYIFAEFTLNELTGLGFQSDPLRVGGPNWTFGLAFEF
jgi:hypothetical protein